MVQEDVVYTHHWRHLGGPCMYAYIYVCVCIYTYIYVYIYIHIQHEWI